MTFDAVKALEEKECEQAESAKGSLIGSALSFGQDVYHYWQPRVMQYLYKPNEKQELLKQLQSANSYEEWHEIALRLDNLQGNDIWRSDPASTYYDYKLIASLVFRLKQLRYMGKLDELAEVIRSGLLRNMGSMTTSELYTCAYGGTKSLIEEYIDMVCDSLIYLSQSASTDNSRFAKTDVSSPYPSEWPTDRPTLKAFFKDTQQSYGRTALILHGGSLFGLCHLGVVKGLLSEQLLPTVICGTTIGSIVAAYVCSVPGNDISDAIADAPHYIHTYDTNEETPELMNGNARSRSGSINSNLSTNLSTNLSANLNGSAQRNDGENDDSENRMVWLGNITTNARNSLFPIELKKFLRFVLDHLGDMTFEEAYLKSGRILNILVLPAGSSTGSFYNYLTTPKVIVGSAVLASIGSNTIPGHYHVDLLVKDYQGHVTPHPDSPMEFLPANERTFVPARDSPYTRLSELFNVNNYVVSVSRPYYAPILLPEFKYRGQPRLWQKLISLLRLSAQYRVSQLADWGLLPPRLKAVFVDEIIPGGFQVNVVPETDALIRDFLLLFDSTNVWMKVKHWINIGERSVWPQMSIIKARSKIEYVLEELYEGFE